MPKKKHCCIPSTPEPPTCTVISGNSILVTWSAVDVGVSFFFFSIFAVVFSIIVIIVLSLLLFIWQNNLINKQKHKRHGSDVDVPKTIRPRHKYCQKLTDIETDKQHSLTDRRMQTDNHIDSQIKLRTSRRTKQTHK